MSKCGAMPWTYYRVTRREDGALKAARTSVRMDPHREFLEEFETKVRMNHGLLEVDVEDTSKRVQPEVEAGQAELTGWCA